jgi:hypothetical protein
LTVEQIDTHTNKQGDKRGGCLPEYWLRNSGHDLQTFQVDE